jgi:hypothetical protein
VAVPISSSSFSARSTQRPGSAIGPDGPNATAQQAHLILRTHTIRARAIANRGHGFVAEDVPELLIAVIASRRREGIVRRLLVGLLDASVAHGYSAVSLSVRKENPAHLLYESGGLRLVDKHGTSWTMARHAP